MPDYATTGGNPGNRGRGPPKQFTGEVTKKSNNQSDSKESYDPPPQFSGGKMFGAKNFLTQDPLVANNIQGEADQDTSLENLTGTGFYTPSSRSTSATKSEEQRHPLAAPIGWRRFWGKVNKDYYDDPDIQISSFCKRCYDADLVDVCNLGKQLFSTKFERYPRGCEDCEMESLRDECLTLITYKHPENISTFKTRHLERDRAHAESIGLAIPTCSTVFSPIVRLPRKPANVTPTPQGISPAMSQGPTYSRVRDSYHTLKSWATTPDEPIERDDPGIAWIQDQSEISLYDLELIERRRVREMQISLAPATKRSISPSPSQRCTAEAVAEAVEEFEIVHLEERRKQNLLKYMTILCALSKPDKFETASK